MTAPRVLVAGIGNIFLGDDAFGVEVVARLARQPMPEGVELLDVGIRGLHLAYQLLEGYDLLVLIDAMVLGEAPGTVALVEVDATPATSAAPGLDAHSITPAAVLEMLAGLGGSVGRTVVVGCQPLAVEEGMGLSAPVAAAVETAAATVVELLVGGRV